MKPKTRPNTETVPVRPQPVDLGAATVLIVDDSRATRRALRAQIEEMGQFEVILEASNGLEAYSMMRKNPVDVVLCDMHMPECDGLGLLRLRRRDARTAHIPVVMLTATSDVDSCVALLSAGASDYVTKPAHPEELRARLTVHLSLKRLNDLLQHKNAELERIAQTDGLTGVFNRRHFDELLAREYDRAMRYRRPMSLLMFDIDHFKSINDTRGHQAGDHVLRKTAEVLAAQVRKPDLLARYGGEEFAVVMPETSLGHAMVAAERLRRELELTRFEWQGVYVRVTASVGVAGFPSVDIASTEDLVRRADEGLYAAKRAGRNRVVHAQAGPVPPTPWRAEMRALRQN